MIYGPFIVMYMSYGWGYTSENLTSDMSHERQDFVTWLLHTNAHSALRISQYENSHSV